MMSGSMVGLSQEGLAPGDSRNLAARLRELSQLELLPASSRSVLAEAAQKLATATVYLAVVGDFKRGKSSLINAILGARLLPVGVLPLTSQPTLIRYGKEPCAVVKTASGTERMAVERIAEYVTEAANPGNRLQVLEAWVEYPSRLLRDGVVVVDTPGTGSMHQQNTDAAHAFLPRIDVALAVLSAESPLSLSEANWFRDVAARASRTVICLNKVDAISAREREEAVEYVRRGVAGILGGPAPTIFTTSARRELDDGNDEGVANLRQWLSDELGQTRSSIAWDSAVQTGGSALELARSTLALERAALAAPVAQARDRARRVLAAQDRLVRVGQEGKAVISAQAADLVRGVVDPGIISIRKELDQRLLAISDDQGWPLELEASARQSGRLLENLVRSPLQQVLRDQAERLQAVLDDFLDEVGGIYQIKLPGAPRLVESTRLPNVRVTLSDEPGALAMGLRSVRRALPGAAGRNWRERARSQEAAEAADRLSGRLRYATVVAIEEATREWLAWSDAEWRGLAEALSAALRRSGEAAAAGEAAAKSQAGWLDSMSEVLAAVADALRPESVTHRDASATS
jgi:GTP-binding protein EngB required for normal cell division